MPTRQIVLRACVLKLYKPWAAVPDPAGTLVPGQDLHRGVPPMLAHTPALGGDGWWLEWEVWVGELTPSSRTRSSPYCSLTSDEFPDKF